MSAQENQSNSAGLQALASTLIDQTKIVKKAEAVMSPLKSTLIQAADGETLTLSVANKGKVTITKPGFTKAVQTVVLDTDVFYALPQKERDRLRKLGVIKAHDVPPKETKASVRVTLNA